MLGVGLHNTKKTYFVVAAVIVFLGSAITAGNLVPQSNAGQGVSVVNGYTVENIGYGVDVEGTEANPIVEDVTFDIYRTNANNEKETERPVTTTTDNVWLQLRSDTTSTDWVQCSIIQNNKAFCDTTHLAMTVKNLTSLSVVAYDTTAAGPEPQVEVRNAFLNEKVIVEGKIYRVVAWDDPDDPENEIVVNSLIGLEYLIVGGGGGGAKDTNATSGGGGAGGVVTNVGVPLTIPAGRTIEATVGTGGAARTTNGVGNDGTASTLTIKHAGETLNTFTADGGGGGGHRGATTRNGRPGASGGGAATEDGIPGGTTGVGLGNVGGAGFGGSSNWGGGGGGGAGEPGGNGTQSNGGKGGDGIQSNITGQPTWYAGGGSGIGHVGNSGSTNPPNLTEGSLGGGGGSAENGVDGTGGGGGGGGGVDGAGPDGGKGGNGIVIVRWDASGSPPAIPSPPTDLTAEPGDASAQLTWVEAFSGGAPIESYNYRYQTSTDETNWSEWSSPTTTNSTNTNFTVPNLTNGLYYRFQVAAVSVAGAGNYSNTSNIVRPLDAYAVVAQNATADYIIQENDGTYYRVLEWTNGTGTLDTPTNTTIDAEYLVVGGGGQGGRGTARPSGGGGAGGLLTNVDGSPLTLSGSVTVEVGEGGLYTGTTSRGPGGTGSPSKISFGETTIEALGGGGGGGSNTTEDFSGTSGGSGGGGGSPTSASIVTPGGDGTAGQGNDGGDGEQAGSARAAGGGGGAGEPGGTAILNGTPTNGKGGDGVQSAITGISKWYAGGGGGGGAAGGLGGGGTDGAAGVDGTGGGAGGVRDTNSNRPTAQKGGDGIVIIRWAITIPTP